MNSSGASTYTQNSKTQRISATIFRWCPIFTLLFFFKLASGMPVVPLLDRWCPWQARGASDWCPCLAGGAPGMPVVTLTSNYVVSLGSSVLPLLGMLCPC